MRDRPAGPFRRGFGAGPDDLPAAVGAANAGIQRGNHRLGLAQVPLYCALQTRMLEIGKGRAQAAGDVAEIHAGNQAPDEIFLFDEQQWTGLQPPDQQATEQHGGGRGTGDTQ